MRREFTQNELDKLLAYVKADKDKNAGRTLGNVVDFFADLWNYSGLDIEDCVNDIDTYHKKLIDAQDFTEDEIKNIFTNVMQADSDSSNFRKEGICSLVSTVEKLTSVIRIDDANPDSVPLFMTGEDYRLFSELLVECDMDDPVLGLTEDEKKKFIELYEKLNPEHAANMEGIVNIFEEDGYDGYEEDLLNIKLLAYTADEPYRSVYLNNIGRVKYGYLNLPKEYKWPHATNGVFYIDKGEMTGERTAATYISFFHESSHCIDYFLNQEGKSTMYYSDSTTGYSLNEILETDVRRKIDETIDNYFEDEKNISDEQKDEIKAYVVDAIMNQVDIESYGSPDFSVIVDKNSTVDYKQVQECYDETVSRINCQLTGSVTDCYGGFTGNTLSGSKDMKRVMHPSIRMSGGKYGVFWIDGGIKDDGTDMYIKLDDGSEFNEKDDFSGSKILENSDLDEQVIMSEADVKYTNLQGMEFFANNMSDNICRMGESVIANEFYNSDTKEYFQKMLQSMK